MPADFLGLSFEARSLPAIAEYSARGDMVALLRSLGPGVMRFGGISADEQAAWVGNGAVQPGWARVAIDEADLAGLAALARASGWRVLLTVNLGHYDPGAAALEAAAARRLLGASLEGIEIGNEPDLLVRKHLRGPGWGIVAYGPQAHAYRAAIAAAAPGTPIAGPDPSTGVAGLGWLRNVASSPTLRPALLTDHYYPLSSCGSRPTVSELLSPNVRRAEGDMLGKSGGNRPCARARAADGRDQQHLLRRAARGLRHLRLGAVGARLAPRGAADFLAGVARGSGNPHDLLEKTDAYSALFAPTPAALGAGALQAAPEWYALLAARAFLGPRPPGRPLSTAVAGAAPGELSASAVRGPGRQLRLVLVDYDPPGSTPLAVHLRVPRGLGGGSVLRLTAPSPTATSGVRLGGSAVAPDGSFTPPSVLPRVSGRAGSLAVGMAPDSAAVVTLSR